MQILQVRQHAADGNWELKFRLCSSINITGV